MGGLGHLDIVRVTSLTGGTTRKCKEGHQRVAAEMWADQLSIIEQQSPENKDE